MGKPFDFKIIAMDEPLANDPFFAWLNENVDRLKVGRGHERIFEYLSSLGFVRGEHNITEEQLKILGYVLEIWYHRTPAFKPKKMTELFDDSKPSYSVCGSNGKLGITSTLKDMIKKTGWIYDVDPGSTYFEIRNGELHAKYQQIIGSRFICKIEE